MLLYQLLPTAMDDNQSAYLKIKAKLQQNNLSMLADTTSDVKYVCKLFTDSETKNHKVLLWQ